MSQNEVHLVSISSDAGLRNSRDVARQFRVALSEHQIISVAYSDAASADITIVQLLLAARQQALASGKSFALASPPSHALRESLIHIGMFDEAGIPRSDADFWLSRSAETESAPA